MSTIHTPARQADPRSRPEPAVAPGEGSQPAVLVTGGAGFIGSRLVHGLLERGARVVVVDDLSTGSRARLDARASFWEADVAAPGRLARILAAEGPFDRLVHLAGRVGVRRVLADPHSCRRIQERSAAAVVSAVEGLAKQHRPRVLAASTSEVYAERRAPLREESPLRSVRGEGRWAYAGSKLAGERMLERARSLWERGAEPVHLRFFNVVGPGQDARGGQVLPTFVEQALAGVPVTVHGDGRQVRTFGHVDDVSEALVHVVLAESLPGGPLNLGGTARIRIGELARLVVRRADSPSAIVHVDPCADAAGFEEVTYRVPSLARARRLGVPLRCRGLEAIVLDTLARHTALWARAHASWVH